MTCPICAKASDTQYRPFCSRRCADIDLGRWLTEGYRIPAEDETEQAATETEDGDDTIRH